MSPNLDKRSLQITAAVLAAVFLLVLAVYWQGLNGPFVLDDRQNVVIAKTESNDFSAIVYRITHNDSGQLGRGVSVLSFIVTEIVHGPESWGFKFDNLLLHLMNGLLMMRLLFVTLPLLERSLAPRKALLVAGLVGSVWLLHPLWVSTVLYVVQRMTELATFFMLLTLLSYVGARNCATPGKRFLILAWGAVPLCFLLALLSKETAVLLPVYLLAFEVLVFRTTWRSLKQQQHVALFLGVFVAVPLLAGSSYLLTHFGSFTNYEFRNFTLPERLLTQVHAIFAYVKMILLPRVGDMGLFHDDFPVTRSLDLVTLALLAVLLFLVGTIWWCRTRAPVLAFGLAWFVISHLLESTFIPLELVFEHRNYMAAIGLLLPVIYYACTIPVLKPAQYVLGFCLPLLFATQTWIRVQEWSSEDMLYTTALVDHPESTRVRINLANYLVENQQVVQAFGQLRVAQLLSPADPGPSIHLYAIQCAVGIREPELLQQAVALLEANPASIHSMAALEFMIGFINNKQCTEDALVDVEQMVNTALAMPKNSTSSQTVGFLHRFLSMVSFIRNDYARGVSEMQLAFEHTGLASLLGELVRYQISLRRLDDARVTLQQIEDVNAQRYGIETYTVNTLRDMLAEAEAAPPSPQAQQ